MFYFPKTRDVSSDDARSFARGREHWLTVNGEHERVPVLRRLPEVVRITRVKSAASRESRPKPE